MDRILIFDLGGVLVVNDMFDELTKLMNKALDKAALQAKWLRSSAVREFELGKCSPGSFARAMVDEFEMSVTPAEFTAAFTHWPKGFYPGVAATLNDLRKQHRTACLSNSNELHWTHDVTSHFDYAYSSHLLGCIKPDGEVFERVTANVGCSPADITYFDDAQQNVDAARACGWHAHVTDGPEELQRTLIQLELLKN